MSEAESIALAVGFALGGFLGYGLGWLRDWWSAKPVAPDPLENVPMVATERGHKHRKPAKPFSEVGSLRIYHCTVEGCHDRIFRKVHENGKEGDF